MNRVEVPHGTNHSQKNLLFDNNPVESFLKLFNGANRLFYDLKDGEAEYLINILSWYDNHDLKNVPVWTGQKLADSWPDNENTMKLYAGTGDLALVKSAYKRDSGFLIVADVCFNEAEVLADKLALYENMQNISTIRKRLDVYANTLSLVVNSDSYVIDGFGLS